MFMCAAGNDDADDRADKVTGCASPCLLFESTDHHVATLLAFPKAAGPATKSYFGLGK